MSFKPETMEEEAFRQHLKVLERHSIEIQGRVRQIQNRVYSDPDNPGLRSFNPNIDTNVKELKDLCETVETLSELIFRSSGDLRFEFDVRLPEEDEDNAD